MGQQRAGWGVVWVESMLLWPAIFEVLGLGLGWKTVEKQVLGGQKVGAGVWWAGGWGKGEWLGPGLSSGLSCEL